MAEDGFVVDVDGTGDVAVVTINGDVDAATVVDLAGAFDGIVREHDRHVVVDGTGIAFIDSTGLSTIMDAQRRLNRTRRRLGVACATASPLGRALAMSGLDRSVDVHRDVEDAVGVLEAAPLLGR